MKKLLIDYVTIIRSKNAGPLYLTFDLIFRNKEDMEFIMARGVVTQETIGKLYDCASEKISIIPYAVVNAIKITLPRKCVSGSSNDNDIYGCQQHMPLANLEVI